MNLKSKISIPLAITVLCGALVIGYVTSLNIDKIQLSVHHQEREKLRHYFDLKFEGQKQSLIKLALTLAENGSVIDALTKNNREIAISGLKGLIGNYKKYSNIEKVKIHIHDKDVTSFVRSWKLNKFGDDLSGFRRTIMSVKQNHVPVSAIEIGRAGLLLRGIAPVFGNDQYLGSVEFIEDLDLIARSAKEEAIDIILIMNKSHLKTATNLKNTEEINNQFVVASAPDEINQNLLNQLKTADILNADQTATYLYAKRPIVDFNGETVGYAVIARDLTLIEAVVDQAKSALIEQVWMVLLVGGLVLSILFFTLYHLLFKPIDIMAKEIADSIEKQDLTRRLTYKKDDELGKISNAFNQFSLSINTFINQINESTIDVSDAASIMASAISGTSGSIKNQELETAEVTENLSVMLTQVQNIAESSQHASSSANKASEQAAASKAISEKTIVSINSLASEIQSATQVIKQLQGESKEIESFTAVIQGIAEQTNLLALNAAIEAARAGESGRGFAVVADEVRSLAEKTQESTQNISTIINRLKASIVNAVGVMEVSNEKAVESVASIDETEKVLIQITGSISQITDINRNIAQVTHEQVPLFKNLSANMTNNVKQFSAMLNQSLDETFISSNQLALSVKEMDEQMGLFKVDSEPGLKLYNAKASVISWNTRVLPYVLGLTEISSDDHVPHTDCQFAQWYYSDESEDFKGLKEFSDLEKVHMDYHRYLDDIVKLKEKGVIDQELLDAAASQFKSAGEQLLQLLDIIAEKSGMLRESKFKIDVKRRTGATDDVELF